MWPSCRKNSWFFKTWIHKHCLQLYDRHPTIPFFDVFFWNSFFLHFFFRKSILGAQPKVDKRFPPSTPLIDTTRFNIQTSGFWESDPKIHRKITQSTSFGWVKIPSFLVVMKHEDLNWEDVLEISTKTDIIWVILASEFHTSIRPRLRYIPPCVVDARRCEWSQVWHGSFVVGDTSTCAPQHVVNIAALDHWTWFISVEKQRCSEWWGLIHYQEKMNDQNDWPHAYLEYKRKEGTEDTW